MLHYSEFISQISFCLIQPQVRNRKAYRKVGALLEKCHIYVDMLNTRIPHDGVDLKTRLRELTNLPRMSTIAIGALINRGVSQMPKNHSFVNVGVWHGFTLFCGMIENESKTCIGVDNFSEFGGPREMFLERFDRLRGPNHWFYEMDYTEYFQRIHRGPIGFYMYDGNHTYDNQLRGLQLAEGFFAKDCIVLVDDINIEEVKQATLEFIAASHMQYRIVFEQQTQDNRHPTWWNGIMVLQKLC